MFPASKEPCVQIYNLLEAKSAKYEFTCSLCVFCLSAPSHLPISSSLPPPPLSTLLTALVSFIYIFLMLTYSIFLIRNTDTISKWHLVLAKRPWLNQRATQRWRQASGTSIHSRNPEGFFNTPVSSVALLETEVVSWFHAPPKPYKKDDEGKNEGDDDIDGNCSKIRAIPRIWLPSEY